MKKVVVLIFDDSDSELADKILELAVEPYAKVFTVPQPEKMLFEGIEIRLLDKSVRMNGKKVHLSKREFSVLCHLARHPGWVQSKQQIFEAVWPSESEADYHAVEAVIYSLRKKIDSDISNPHFIYTVFGHGYRFIGKKIS